MKEQRLSANDLEAWRREAEKLRLQPFVRFLLFDADPRASWCHTQDGVIHGAKVRNITYCQMPTTSPRSLTTAPQPGSSTQTTASRKRAPVPITRPGRRSSRGLQGAQQTTTASAKTIGSKSSPCKPSAQLPIDEDRRRELLGLTHVGLLALEQERSGGRK